MTPQVEVRLMITNGHRLYGFVLIFNLSQGEDVDVMVQYAVHKPHKACILIKGEACLSWQLIFFICVVMQDHLFDVVIHDIL